MNLHLEPANLKSAKREIWDLLYLSAEVFSQLFLLH